MTERARGARFYARASGMPLLVGLLVVTFAIAGDLAHEAWTTARAQRETADRAVREFVRFAATSLAYKAQNNITAGLSALFGPVTTQRGVAPSGEGPAPAPESLVRAAERVRECACAPDFHPSYYFRLALADGELRIAGSGIPAGAERSWLRDTLVAHLHAARRPEWDVALIQGGADARPLVVAYAVRDVFSAGRAYAYGFVSDAGAFGDAVFAPLSRERVATPGYAGQAVSYDSLVSTSVLAANGRAIYDVNPRRPELRMTMVPRVGHETYAVGPAPLSLVTLFADTVHLGRQFGGLILDVALTTSTPADLVAGGLPRSRLLVLLGLLLLMAGLVAVAVLQLRREHELARLRADFTTGVSHELRTPLAQILLYGETLMLERTRSDRERRSAAEVIVREARRLMHLVENALHFARADRQLLRLSPEPVALAALTREILVGFAPLAWAARVTLAESLDDEACVLIDAGAYRQILLNLLDNAVKYGPAGQAITVRLERVDRDVLLAVEDEGPGVPVSERGRVWAPFVRVDATSNARLGTGIGLAVVRDLTLRHGGRVRVEDATRPARRGARGGATGGARFVVELPSATREESGRQRTTGSSRAAL